MQNKKTILIISIAIVLLLSGVIIYLISRVRNTEKEMLEMVEMASYEKEQLENERLREENKLLKAKTKSIEDAADTKAAYENVIKVLRDYAGYGDPNDEY